MPGNFCNTCQFWEGPVFQRSGDDFGQCHQVMVHSKVTTETKTVLEEDGTVFTEAFFGCVYWRDKGNNFLTDHLE